MFALAESLRGTSTTSATPCYARFQQHYVARELEHEAAVRSDWRRRRRWACWRCRCAAVACSPPRGVERSDARNASARPPHQRGGRLPVGKGNPKGGAIGGG